MSVVSPVGGSGAGRSGAGGSGLSGGGGSSGGAASGVGGSCVTGTGGSGGRAQAGVPRRRQRVFLSDSRKFGSLPLSLRVVVPSLYVVLGVADIGLRR